MPRLTIRHETTYTYERPIAFGPQRLLLRPRDGHASRIIDASLTFSPAGATRWVYDAMGNCVCWFTPAGQATRLSIISDLVIDRFPAPLSPMRIDNPHTAMPIVYARPDRIILAPYLEPETEDPTEGLLDWVHGHLAQPDEPALDFLLRLNRAIHDQFAYRARPEQGVQDPALTIALGSGTCRDFAWLMVEALRRLGYAAAFVTGYLHSPGASEMRGAGATHAWCEVFLPDLGWTQFDPTNGLAESSDLITVAVTRTPDEAAPIRGKIIGDPGGSEMFVRVDVRQDGLVHAAA